MAKKRNGRQDAIRDIVRNKDVRTQRVLVDELRAMGFDCTQATVSRDIADMGLRKLPEGIYVLAEDLHLQRMVSELVTGVLRTDNLVMIKAQPGTASGIAAAVDAAELPDVLGSLAGNDTILVIAQTAEDGERLEADLVVAGVGVGVAVADSPPPKLPLRSRRPLRVGAPAGVVVAAVAVSLRRRLPLPSRLLRKVVVVGAAVVGAAVAAAVAPMPTSWSRCRCLPSVWSAGATMTSARWNEGMSS